MQITRNNSLDSSQGPDTSFTGTVYVDAVAVAAPEPPARVGAASVHFTPGARTHWHTHPFGQTIFVTEGIGCCQRQGRPVGRSAPATACSSSPARTTGTAPPPTAS
jgi:quercetin dioxygenase-like cupin family protein